MNLPPSTETFSAQELKEARHEFQKLKKLMNTCQVLSQDISKGDCDFNAILACLYAIERNPMYNFLAEKDDVFKQIIDVTFLRLRKVGGIIQLSNKYEENMMTEKEKKEMEKLDNNVKELESFVNEKKLNELDLKRKLEEIIDEDEETPVIDEMIT